MRHLLVAFSILLGASTSARAQVSVGIDIGIHVPVYPRLVQVPGHPVYYAPAAGMNYFFYDGGYWVFHGDAWYVSSWYNGPWHQVAPERVPLFVLRVPVRYYRAPPPYFRGWHAERPPRWGERWGGDWERSHRGWDRWDRRHAPRPAPLPAYQRRYEGERYPRAAEQQHAIRSDHYRYRPREGVTRERFGPGAAPQRRGGPEQGPARPHRDEGRGDRGEHGRGHDRGHGRP